MRMMKKRKTITRKTRNCKKTRVANTPTPSRERPLPISDVAHLACLHQSTKSARPCKIIYPCRHRAVRERGWQVSMALLVLHRLRLVTGPCPLPVCPAITDLAASAQLHILACQQSLPTQDYKHLLLLPQHTSRSLFILEHHHPEDMAFPFHLSLSIQSSPQVVSVRYRNRYQRWPNWATLRTSSRKRSHIPLVGGRCQC